MSDLSQQTRQPRLLVIVDGDPASGEVREALCAAEFSAFQEVVYLPSNHANLPYQRYLGWRASGGCEWLLYLDDDLRISQPDFIEKLLEPFSWPGQDIAGVTAEIVYPNRGEPCFAGALSDRVANARSKPPLFVSLFGGGRKIPPGGLTPSGDRKPPACRGRGYEPAEWLRGGVMACRADALDADCFPEAIFESNQRGCGLGEDTLLSRRLRRKGRLLYAFCARAEHPDAGLPAAYRIDDFGLGYGTAFSRRLLNDYYRGAPPPRLSDRLDLFKSYAGNFVLNWSRAFSSRKRHRWAYAWGYTLGVVSALSPVSAAQNSGPKINWSAEADRALAGASIIDSNTVRAQ